MTNPRTPTQPTQGGELTTDEVYHDALVWVSNDPEKYPTIRDFVIEAELRGCCRQLSQKPYPTWLKPGKSRVFLVHRDELRRRDQAAIFGYYVVGRLEQIPEPPPAGEPHGTAPQGEFTADGFHDEHGGHGTRSGSQEDKVKRSTGGGPRTGTMTHPRPPRRVVRLNLEDLLEELSDLIPEDLKKRIVGKIVDFLTSDPREQLKQWMNELECHRSCSRRKGPGALYAIDAYCATIHDTFYALVAELRRQASASGLLFEQLVAEIKRENDRRWNAYLKRRRAGEELTIDDLANTYYGLFQTAVALHRSDRPRHERDHRLVGKATQHHELVVFDDPMPVYEAYPDVFFQNAIRVDGEMIIESVARHAGRKVYLAPIKRRPGAGRHAVASRIASQMHTTCADADRFLDGLARAYVALPEGRRSSLEHLRVAKLGRLDLSSSPRARSPRSVKFELRA
jgi:hypothetical protein